jgi:Putative adhesin
MREKNQKIQIKSLLIFFTIYFLLGANFAYSQIPPKAPAQRVQPPDLPKPNWKHGKRIINTGEIPIEKSILVDPKVNLSLCVSEGNLKVNGWERNEIRVFVNDGSQAGFKVQQKGGQSGTPVWVMILGFDPSKNKEAGADECLSGEEIELDVPRGATVNVKSNESQTTIDSVRKVTVENVGGDIALANIAEGIRATTYQGDVTVEKSGGAMSLTTTTGNIVVFDVSPSEIGDIFKAKTNSGAIILKQTGHRQIEASSNSGAIRFTGELLSGGLYNFNAFNGSINLLLNPNLSCKIFASYNFGAFNSEIPYVINSTPKGQNLNAQIGKGEATLNLTTYSGTIQIKKQP